MRRLTVLAGALGAALLMSSAAFAQVPPDPANPNEAIPEAANLPAYGESINIENAKKAAAAAIAEAKKRNWNIMCIAVVDTHGELVYFEKQDNCASRLHGNLAAQSTHCGALPAPNIGVRAFDRQGPLLRLSDNARRRHRLARRQSNNGRRQGGRCDRRKRWHRIAGRRRLTGGCCGIEVVTSS